MAGFLTMRVIENEQSRHTTKRLIRLILLFALVGIFMNGVEEQLRVAATPTLFSAFQDRAFLERTRTIYLGHLAAFSAWFDTYLKQMGGATFGARTFAGPLNLLGISTRVTGVYTTFVFVGGGPGKTNIYTAQRGVIEDFTLVGAEVWYFLLGILGGFAYRGCRKRQILAVPGLLTYYLWTGWYVVSAFTYNSVCLAALFTSGYIILVLKHRANFTIRGGLQSKTFRLRFGQLKLDELAQ